MRKKFLTAVVLSIALLAFAVRGCFAAGPISDKENAHLTRLNEARAANGLPELKLSAELTAAAKIRAQEITGLFSHDRPNGTKFFTAIANQTGWNGISENIAAGKGLDTAYNAVDVLMASAGHRANILTKNNVCVGVATYQDAKGEYFWVEIFAAVRPQRDADKTPEGSTNEPKFIESVNDPSLTVDGAGLPKSSIGTFDYYANASRASVTQLIKDSQARGNYTLFVLWNTSCRNINHEQVQAEAHARKESVTINSISANTDTTLPRIFELEDVDIILFNYYGQGLDGYGTSAMKSAMDTYCPSFGAANSVWKNAVLLRTTNSAYDETIAKGYGNFFPGIVPANSNPSVTLYVLYKDGKMIAKAQGISQSNTFDQWAKKIAALSDARTPNADEPNDGGEGDADDGGEQEEHFDAPTTIETLKEAMGTEAAKKLTDGVNAVTFVGGECKAVTNDGSSEPAAPTFTQGRSITHALYVIKGGEIDSTRDGETVTAEVLRGVSVILSKKLTIQGGKADVKFSVDEILNATPIDEDQSIRAAELIGGYSLRIRNEAGDIDLKTDFRIEKADEPQPNSGGGSSGGGCSVGAAALALAAIALIRRGTRY